MSLTYVIPDLHGRSDLLEDALDKIGRHAGAADCTVVGLGDYVDKGPDTRAVIARLRAGFPDRWRFVPLKGNHDAMMVRAVRDSVDVEGWLAKGGDAVARSYGGVGSISPDDTGWLDRLALMHVDEHRVYVHAGLDAERPLDDQLEATLLWKRYPRSDPSGYRERHVVHGHDSVLDGPLFYEGRTNLDTRAWRTGRLVVGVFDDDLAGGPINLLSITGPPIR